MKQSIEIFILFIATVSLAWGETITLVADQWCPMNCKPNSERPGYAIEISKAIFEPHGHKIVYSNLSWSRALHEVDAGSYSGAIAATPADLPNGIFPQEAIGGYSNDFYVLKDTDWQFDSIDSLKSVKLGIAEGYDYGPDLNQYIEENPDKIFRIGGDNITKRGLRMLMDNRLDVYLDDMNVILYTAYKHKYQRHIRHAGREGNFTQVYVGFSFIDPNNKQLAKTLSDGIRSLRKSGELQTILDKYGLQDWKTTLK